MSEIDTYTVTIGGQDRPLRLTPYAFRLAGKHHGVRVETAAMVAGGLDNLPLLLWIGLLPGDVRLKEETVLDWIGQLSVADEMALYRVVTLAAAAMHEGSEKVTTVPPRAQVK